MVVGSCFLKAFITGSGSIGQIPVVLKDARIFFSTKELFQALQNNGKKSPFLIRTRP
jgi:hypothetical protein